MAIASNSIVRLGLDSNKYEKGIREAKKQWDDFTKSMGLSTGKISAIGAAIGAVTTALKVAKDAFSANEAIVDEWGRTVNTAKGMYEGFLNALNNGDISGYLRNIDSIVNAARKAYDEMDRLGTMRTIQAPEISMQQTENERLRSMIRTGRYIAPLTGGGEAGMVNGQQLTAEQIRIYESQLNDGVNKVVDLMSNEIRQTSSAIDAIYNSMATNMRMSIDEFRLGTSSMAEFDKRIEGAAKYRQYISDNTVTTISPTTGIRSSYYAGGKNPYEQYAGWDVFRVDGAKFNELVNLITNRNQQTSGVYGQMAQAYQTINRVEGTTVRSILGGGWTSGTTDKYTPLAGSIDAQVQKVKELQDAFNAAGSEGVRMGLLPQLREAEQELERMRTIGDFMATAPTGIPGTEMSALPKFNYDNSAMSIKEEEVKRADALAKLAEINKESWQSAANAIGNVGQALQNIESPAAKVAGIIAEAIATIAATFASSLKGTVTPWDWIAGAAAGTATMIATIAAIKQATAGSYATGGIVPGNNYQDGLTARVSSGELILNQAQQGTLASRLQQGSMLQNMHLEATLSGEDMRIAITNNLRRSGSGETINLRLQ